jgi:hypothetical protein
MPKDVWSEDRSERAIVLQQRSDAVANDTTPTINALARLEPYPKLGGVLLRRVSDRRVIHREVAEAERLIASGEYRPITPSEGYSENGALSCQADPEDVEFGRKERIAALARLRSGDDLERVVQEELTRLAGLTDEELDRLSADLDSVLA